MGFWLGKRGLLGVVLGLALCFLGPAGVARGAQKARFTHVKFETVDFVELQGTFYPATGGKKEHCVLLLHNISSRTGGTSHDDPWDKFAERLQDSGYDVLSFDFRGFGRSTSVGEDFWDRSRFPYNQMIRNAAKKPSLIDFKDFPQMYYPNLANDVAAARAFLDHRNDQNQVNSSNLIVVGAGEGATIGLLWMAAEARLQKDLASNRPALVQIPEWDEPEGKDIACAIWLNLSPSLANRSVPVSEMVRDVTTRGKIRTALLFSKNDQSAAGMARRLVELANSGTTRAVKMAVAKEVKGTGTLSGSKLLNSEDANEWIMDKCLPDVLEKRSVHERRSHDIGKYAFAWAFPWPGQALPQVLAKRPTEKLIGPIPITRILGR